MGKTAKNVANSSNSRKAKVLTQSEKRTERQRRIRKQIKSVVVLFKPDEISHQVHQCIQRDFESQGPITEYNSCVSPSFIFHHRQDRELLKKYKSSLNSDLCATRAFDLFQSVNARMGVVNDSLRLPANDCPSAFGQSERNRVLLRARQIAWEILTETVDVKRWFEKCKHSQGTSIGLEFSKTNLEDKWKFPLSTTKRVKDLFEFYLKSDVQLSEAITLFNGKSVYTALQPYKVLTGSRTTTVDKNDEIDRTISVEPTLNMFFQQGLMAMLYDLFLPYFDISKLQDKHQYLAFVASVTRHLATIDFSSASDSVSITFLKWFLPPQWYYVLDMVRSPVTTVGEESVDLNMFSTMGNATTFPIETLIFYCIACAISATYESRGTLITECDLKKLNVSVYGDDCILPDHHAEQFMSVCESIGFVVNRSKSFHGKDVYFRESCGADFFRGHNVRPFNLKVPHNNKLSSYEPWCYIIVNRLLKKYMSYFGVTNYIYQPGLLAAIELLIGSSERPIKIKVVPDDYPDDAGIKIFNDLKRFRALFPSVQYARVGVDKHGTIDFSCTVFKYASISEGSNVLHYYNWIKNPKVTTDEFFPESKGGRTMIKVRALKKMSDPNHDYVSKRIGGYVVERHRSISDLALTLSLPSGRGCTILD